MFRGIYNILTTILGESKQGGYDKDTVQHQFNCPKCAEDNGGIPDGKFNLEVNLQKQVYKCWKCCDTDGTLGRLPKLIKKYGNGSLYIQYKSELDALIKSKMYDINAFKDQLSGFTETEETFIALPDSFTKITDIEKCKNKKVVDYLKKRNIGQDLINKYNIGYTTWEDSDYYCRNRIVVPSYDEFGDLNYWSARDFSGKAKSKYKNCDAQKEEIIFQESLIDWDSDIILCEGTIDALCLPNSISLLGKILNKQSKLYKTLRDRANGRVIICLDGDTDISETKKIYNTLNVGRLKGKVYYIRLEYLKDFGEIYQHIGKKGMIKIVSKAKQFGEIDLII